MLGVIPYGETLKKALNTIKLLLVLSKLCCCPLNPLTHTFWTLHLHVPCLPVYLFLTLLLSLSAKSGSHMVQAQRSFMSRRHATSSRSMFSTITSLCDQDISTVKDQYSLSRRARSIDLVYHMTDHTTNLLLPIWAVWEFRIRSFITGKAWNRGYPYQEYIKRESRGGWTRPRETQ